MVIGGQAVLLYGEPRLTKDIDITLGIGPDELESVKKVVREIKLKILVRNSNNFVKKTFVLPTIDKKSSIRVDFIFSYSLYEKQAIKRARKIKFGKTPIAFASLEDVVIHKIISGRQRDIEDVKIILLKNKKYNKQYIKKWLKTFDTSLKENYSKTFKKILRNIK